MYAIRSYYGCTAIHPGYGFFSEDFRFARRATNRERALTFIGPNWQVIRDLGDKINTKRVANQLGIPTIPGTDAPIYNEMEAEEIAAQLLDDQKEEGIKYPSMASKLDYIPMPNKVVDQIGAYWSKNIKGADGKPVWAMTNCRITSYNVCYTKLLR